MYTVYCRNHLRAHPNTEASDLVRLGFCDCWPTPRPREFLPEG